MQFFFLINAIVFVRLFFFFKDAPVSYRKLIYLNILQIIPLIFFELSVELFLFAALLITINVIFFYLEKTKFNLNLTRFLGFVSLVFLAGIFTSSKVSLIFNSDLINYLKNLTDFIFFLPSFENLEWVKINIVLTGVLILLNEVNFLIRYFFEIFALVPKTDPGEQKVDVREYNAGRVIGMLERILIYFFVMIGQFAAIGFIIAAKGFTRFKELDKREFAEYVLTGTLLSSLLAILIALLIKSLVNL